MKKIALIAAALAFPLTSFAQTLSGIENLVKSIDKIVDLSIPILFTIALLGFFYGLVKYIFGSEHDKDVAKKTMLWGVVALFVMASVWGLVNFLQTSLGVEDDAAPPVNKLIPQN